MFYILIRLCEIEINEIKETKSLNGVDLVYYLLFSIRQYRNFTQL